MDTLILVFKSIRVSQWVKNIIILPRLFLGFLFVPGYFEKVTWAFGLFCLLVFNLCL